MGTQAHKCPLSRLLPEVLFEGARGLVGMGGGASPYEQNCPVSAATPGGRKWV